jgi:hypothetical protein
MSRITSLSTASKLNVMGLAVAAIGMLLQIAAGSQLYPSLTGPIVLLLAAAVVAFAPGRWPGYIGLVIPLVLLVGLSVSALLSSAFFEQLKDIGNAGIVLGSLLHVVGLSTAVGGGVGMVLRGRRAAGHVQFTKS